MAGKPGLEGLAMPVYRLEIFDRPREGLPEGQLPEEQRRKTYAIDAADDVKAIVEAARHYARLAYHATLDRFVLYEGERVVHEHTEPRG
jgi:hypothetical protein